ncbi:MAG: ribonuclease III [Alphaproteobacteria bacterium]|nr:ribonuclease III [Alphaproteobacteria bacterium]
MTAKRTGGSSGRGRGRSDTTASSPSLTELEDNLGHSFQDKKLLRRALTHASANTAASNERLEFLGDRVLGLICAERLHALYPKDQEGALALKFNALARRETCAVAAEAAGIAPHLILAKAEAGSGGRRKVAILSGACEAVIAALYLDGGMDAARHFVDLYFTDAFASLSSDMRDPKTVLQEWAQSRGGTKWGNDAPVYRLVGQEGPDHAPRFSVEVSVAGKTPEIGSGGSKREAEQDAARHMLEKLGKLP